MAKKPERPKVMPSRETLWSLLDYDPETGFLTWKARSADMFDDPRTAYTWNGKHAGKPALTISTSAGHRYGAIWGVRYYAHRVAFKMMTGLDPIGVDHIDGDPSNNSWANIREADQRINMRNASLPRNNKSGHVGVRWYGVRDKWVASIKVDRRNKTIGYFDKIEDAIAARRQAAITYGFHENHGRRSCG